MFKESDQIEKFEPKVWLSSPTMHGEEFEFLKEAYETNWMSTVGANINEVERLVCKKIVCRNGSSSYGSKAGRSKTRRESFLF